MKTHRLTSRRSAMVLGVLGLSLLLRADGCVTAERDLNGSVAIALSAEWQTRGFVESTGTDGELSDAEIDEIFDALDDADVEAIARAVDDGQEVQVAGLRAFVTRSGGHDAARTSTLRIDTGSGLAPAANLSVSTNVTGTEASAANGGITVDAGFTGLGNLKAALQDFLEAYLDDDRTTAANILRSVSWSAAWSSTPAPSAQSPDDFDWTTEIIVLVPAQYAIEVPNF